MSLAVERQDVQEATSVITLRGKMMLGEEASQLESLLPVLLKSGRRNLIFDLSGVTHIDSTGIGRFIDTYSRLGQARRTDAHGGRDRRGARFVPRDAARHGVSFLSHGRGGVRRPELSLLFI